MLDTKYNHELVEEGKYDKYMQNHLTIAEKDYLDMLNKEVFDIEK